MVTAFLVCAMTGCGSDESAPAGSSAPPAAAQANAQSSRIAATAEEVAAEGRGKVKCPAKISSPPRAADAPVDDVVGVRPGMTYEEAANVVMCTNDLLVPVTDSSRGFKIQTYGQTLRQGFSARFAEQRINKTSKEIMQEMQDQAMARSANSVVRDMQPGQSKWFVGTMGMPGQERVISAAREEWFAEGRNPTMASVAQALIDKYGTPTTNRDSEGVQRYMTWVYDPIGRPVTEASPLAVNCRGTADPDGGVSLSPDCGIVINANIVSLRANPELSEYIQVGMVDQANGYEAIQATEQGFEAMEAERRAKQVQDAAKNADAPKL
jgi:hypothetical protein